MYMETNHIFRANSITATWQLLFTVHVVLFPKINDLCFGIYYYNRHLINIYFHYYFTSNYF